MPDAPQQDTDADRRDIEDLLDDAPGYHFGAAGGVALLLGFLLLVTLACWAYLGVQALRAALLVDIAFASCLAAMAIYEAITRGVAFKRGERILDKEVRTDRVRTMMTRRVDPLQQLALVFAVVVAFGPGLYGMYTVLTIDLPDTASSASLVEDLRAASTSPRKAMIIERIAALGPAAQDALPELRRIARNRDEAHGVRVSARKAIRAIEAKD